MPAVGEGDALPWHHALLFLFRAALEALAAISTVIHPQAVNLVP